MAKIKENEEKTATLGVPRGASHPLLTGGYVCQCIWGNQVVWPLLKCKMTLPPSHAQLLNHVQLKTHNVAYFNTKKNSTQICFFNTKIFNTKFLSTKFFVLKNFFSTRNCCVEQKVFR